MVSVLDTDVAYAAGLFDGEGCVYVVVTKTKKFGDYFYPMVLVDMTDEQPIRWLEGLFGGRVNIRDRAGRRRSYRWNLTGDRAKGFLDIVSPYLKVKAEQAGWMLSLDGRNNGAEIKSKISELNH